MAPHYSTINNYTHSTAVITSYGIVSSEPSRRGRLRIRRSATVCVVLIPPRQGYGDRLCLCATLACRVIRSIRCECHGYYEMSNSRYVQACWDADVECGLRNKKMTTPTDETHREWSLTVPSPRYRRVTHMTLSYYM